jgi:hypothetical protein
MGLSTLDRVLWAAGFLGHVVLFTILVLRRRWREFPVFTILIGFNGLRTILLYWMYMNQHGSWAWYTRVYYSCAVLDFALQLGIMWEICRVVMRPTGTWLKDARLLFTWGSVAGVMLAVVASWIVPVQGVSQIEIIKARANSFNDLLICELVIVMMLTSKWLGLGFRNHVFGLALGWVGWIIGEVLFDGFHNIFVLGYRSQLYGFEEGRKLVYIGALVYWIVQFWLDEPANRVISPELREYIFDLHRRIENDLDRVNAQK